MNRPQRPWPRGGALAALTLAIALGGCSRLENIGRPPVMTAPGAPEPTIPHPSPKLIALSSAPNSAATEKIASGSLWRSGPQSLFGDRRARVLGDILTVVIKIDDKAEIKNATTRNRSSSEDMAIPHMFGIEKLAKKVMPNGTDLDPAVGANSASTASGDGSIKRNEKLTLRIAATVVGVLPNGHLAVQGDQEVRVNFELRDLQVAGIIRPEDISRRNTITYDKMADARISYGGRGQITDVQQPRYGQQVLDIIAPF